MKGMRGRFLGKLKSISTITAVKQSLVFQANTLDQYFGNSKLVSDVKDEEIFRTPMSLKEVKNDPIVSVKAVSDTESEKHLSLVDFEEKCPPGGSDSVILYTTSLRGIRKTFEDCNTIRYLLESFRVSFDERDVSMHLEFREELWQTLGGRVIPPCLFIKGRHIGGVDEVVGLHEQGKLVDLLKGIPQNTSGRPCKGCGGVRFVLCFSCDGSRRVVVQEQADLTLPITCVECNENGLVKCPICCVS